MRFNRRSVSLAGTLLAGLALIVAACTQDASDPLLPPPPGGGPERPPPSAVAELECRGSVVAQKMVCERPRLGAGSASANVILGDQGNNIDVRVFSTNTNTHGDTISSDLQVVNLLTQAIGTTDGVNADSIKVFFNQEPRATRRKDGNPVTSADSVRVLNYDGTGTFTGTNQEFFSYHEILAPGDTSAARTWHLSFAPQVDSFAFRIKVSAPVQFPNGWTVADADSIYLEPGAKDTITASALNFGGNPTAVDTVVWSGSGLTLVPLNDSTVEVTAGSPGTFFLIGADSIRTGAPRTRAPDTVKVVVNTPFSVPTRSYEGIANANLALPADSGLIRGLVDPDGQAITAVAADSIATAKGGWAKVNADGSFTYHGAPALAVDDVDSLTYQATDGVETVDALAEIKMIRRVWYVMGNGSSSASGTGTRDNPFNLLTSAGTASTAAGEHVYVRSGSDLPDGISLDSAQNLIGQGVEVVETLNGHAQVLLEGTGTTPVVDLAAAGVAVTLGEDNQVRGLELRAETGAGTGVLGNGFGTFRASQVSIYASGPALNLADGTAVDSSLAFISSGSSGRGVSLTNVNGHIVVPAGNGSGITGSAGAAVYISGGNVLFHYHGQLTQANAAPLVQVEGGHTGHVVFGDGTLSATNGTGLQFNNAAGNYEFDGTTTLNGGDAGIDVAGSTGQFSFGGGVSINNPSGPAINVTGGAPTLVDFIGTVTTSAGRPVVVDGITGGVVQVGGTLSAAAPAAGILVQNATGGTVRFNSSTSPVLLQTGGNHGVTLLNNEDDATIELLARLQIETTTGNGFDADSGGTVLATSAENTVQSAGGVAVRLARTTLHSSNLRFRSVKATGGLHGILLQNTKGTGLFRVTGDGSTAGSGDTIKTTTGHAVRLENTSAPVELAFMRIEGGASGNAGISGLGVDSLHLGSTQVATTGGPALSLQHAAVGGTLTQLQAQNSASNGVILNNVTGSLVAQSASISGSASTAFAVVGGTVGVEYNGNITHNAVSPLLSVTGGHGTGALLFQGGTLSTAGGASGLRFDNADGAYTFSGTTTLAGDSAGVDILNDSDGAFTFGVATSITGVAGTAFNLDASGADVTYNGFITKGPGTAGRLVAISNQDVVAGNDVVFQTGTLQAQAGDGILLSNADGTVSFNGTTTLAGGDAGIDVAAGSGGTFSFASGVAVTSPSGTAFAVSSSSPSVVFNGNLTQATAAQRLVDVNGQTGGTITFQTGTLSATNGTGIGLTSAAGTVNFTGTTTLNGSDAGVDVISSTGTVFFGASASVTNPTGVAISLTGGAPDFTWAGSFTKNNNSATGISVSGTGAGADIAFTADPDATPGLVKTLSTGTAAAVDLQNNTGANITFSGGDLSIATTTGTGFSATGGGTVQVTADDNTISSVSGTALNVQNTTIGAGDLVFRSISAGNATADPDPSAGIVLNNTGSTGGLTVTGTGVAGSGGTLQNIAGSGVRATSARDLSLSWMNLTNASTVDGGTSAGTCSNADVSSCNGAVDLDNVTGVSLTRLAISGSEEHGIVGRDVTNFAMANTTVQSAGDEAHEHGVKFLGLYGTSSVTSSSVTNSAEANFRVLNTSGTLTLTVTGSTFSNNSNGLGGDGFLVDAQSTANVTVNVSGSTFTANKDDHFNVTGANSAVVNVTFANNTLSGGHPSAVGQGIALRAGGTYAGTFTYDLDNNTVNGAIPTAINVGFGSTAAGGVLRGRIRNNDVGTAGVAVSGSAQGSCILAEANGTGTGTHTVSITNNIVRRCFDKGIDLLASRDGSNNMNATVTGNNVDEIVDGGAANSRDAIRLETGSSLATETGLVCFDASGNTLNAAFLDEIRIRQRSNATVRMPGYTGGAADDAAVQTYLRNRNTVGGAGTVTVTHTAAAPFQNTSPAGSACPTPP